MQSTRKTVTDKKTKKETRDELLKKDDENKKSNHNMVTPRRLTQKKTADIYSKTNSSVKDVKKVIKTSIKDAPRPSSTQNTPKSRTAKMAETPRAKASIRTTEKNKLPIKNVPKTLPSNITVNSPIVKRKSDLARSKKVDAKEVLLNTKEDFVKTVAPERQRTKTRTLDEEEIKVLTPDAVDNNAELLNLSKKLSAKPKAFYVDFNAEEKKPNKDKSSDDEVVYEDDFESYESDFDSYHSDERDGSDGEEKATDDDQVSDDDDERKDDVRADDEDANLKEEKMLDSGTYELRDPRSATRSKPMDFISEVSEEEGKALKGFTDDNDKKTSLTDEGFQDMSSGLSSIKTVHVEVLNRPLFIDFTKSKENRRKRRLFEKYKQRAKDILSMVTLHEMSYNLFEMAPIPYELYMATFGRLNYTQTAVQTFEDGIPEEVQTEEILCETKWSQFPVEFSDQDIYINDSKGKRNTDLDEFNLFAENEISNIDDGYKSHPLRIYLEQKDGAGPDQILPYDNYKTKLKDNAYNVQRLRKFLKKFESRICNVLSLNTGNTELSNLRSAKFSFSAGYMLLSTKDSNETFLRNSKIISTVLSENKSNLIITVHGKLTSGIVSGKCVLCLWDLSVASREPLKILISTDNVKIGRFRGSTDGYFVGALDDGSIQLWDLSEQPTWTNDAATANKSTETVDVDAKNLSQTERDREWNLKNSNNYDDEQYRCLLQASSYTSSGTAVKENEAVDGVVGLEFVGGDASASAGGGRKVLSQICSLQRTGVLTIWSIVHEKQQNSNDIGKALWSKLKLEKNHTIDLIEYINVPINTDNINFNLNAAKKRIIMKKQERNLIKNSRPKSAIVDRPKSGANVKNKISTNYLFDLWENGVVFNHLKVSNVNGVDGYLVAKNRGEVLCCRRYLGAVKVKTLRVANAASSVTRLHVSPHGLPHFLAGTDAGCVSLCSLVDHRVLLRLECGSSPSASVEKCLSDHRGRYISSVPMKRDDLNTNMNIKQHISSLSWSHSNPFRIFAVSNTALSVWELTQSDMRATGASGDVADCCSTDRVLALLTSDGDVQIHKMKDEENNLDLFKKYVNLL